MSLPTRERELHSGRQRSESDLLQIFAVEVTRVDRQENVEQSHDDHGQVNGFVLQEIGVGEDVVPVHRRRENVESTGELRQMRGETVRLFRGGQWPHRQSIGSPLIVFVEIKAARRVQTKFVVRGEDEFFSGIQFSKSEDQRVMIQCLIILNQVPEGLLFTRRRKDRPSIDQFHFTGQHWRTIESVDQQIREIDLQRMQFQMKRSA